MRGWQRALQEGNYDFEIDFSKLTRKCYHEFKFERGESVCVWCGLIQNMEQYVSFEKTINYDFWPRVYVRKQYFDALFNKLTGKEMIELSTSYLDEFVGECIEPADWYDIYQHFKAWYLKDWWICWNILSDNPKRICMEPKHYYMLLYIDSQWNGSSRVKKKINVFYALYKIMELTGYDSSWVPMKLRAIAITRLDEEWEKICTQLKWQFVPTCKKLKKFYWKTKLYI